MATATKADEQKPWDPADTKMPPEQVEMIARKTAERDLWQEIAPLLKEAGLSDVPGRVNGRQFILVPTGDGAQESPRGIVSGTVTGHYVDTEGALTFCLSEPYPQPATLKRVSGKWELHYSGRRGQRAVQECQFDLL